MELFNANLIKRAKGLIDEKYKDLADSGNISLMTIGKKGMISLEIKSIL